MTYQAGITQGCVLTKFVNGSSIDPHTNRLPPLYVRVRFAEPKGDEQADASCIYLPTGQEMIRLTFHLFFPERIYQVKPVSVGYPYVWEPEECSVLLLEDAIHPRSVFRVPSPSSDHLGLFRMLVSPQYLPTVVSTFMGQRSNPIQGFGCVNDLFLRFGCAPVRRCGEERRLELVDGFLVSPANMLIKSGYRISRIELPDPAIVLHSG